MGEAQSVLMGLTNSERRYSQSLWKHKECTGSKCDTFGLDNGSLCKKIIL